MSLRLVASVCCAALAVPHTAAAFVGTPAARTSSLRVRGSLRATPPPGDAHWRGFVAAAGGSWRGLWDSATGLPVQVYGAGIPATGAVANAAAAAKHARALVARHIDWLAPGSVAADFRLAANHVLRGVRSVTFQQHYRGTPVIGAYIYVAFKRDRLVLFGSRAAPHVRVAALPARTDAIYARLGANGALRYHPVTVVERSSTRPLDRWIEYTDAVTGKLVARRSLLFSGTGQVLLDVPVRHPGGARENRAAGFASTTVNGTAQTCDVDGNVTWTGGAPASVGTQAAGSYVTVDNLAGGDLAGNFSLDNGGSVVWSAAADEFGDAQLSAYAHVNAAKDAARVLNPGLAWLDQPTLAQVNAMGECNAYSFGDNLYFLRGGMFEGQACENPARVADIVIHEAGHSVHVQSIIPGMGAENAALGEGLADYFAATTLNDPSLGEGFVGTGPLRHLDPAGSEASWPDDVNVDPHLTGLIIAGALWDLRKALIAELGQAPGKALADQLFYAVVQRAADIPSAYAIVLLEDDDDGDLANGTPNKCTIDSAFFAHGLGEGAGAAGVTVATSGRTVQVTAPAPEPGCPMVTGAELVWRVRGDSGAGDRVTMTAVSDGFAGDIPAQADDTVVEYQVHMTTSTGATAELPRNPAAPWFELYVGSPEIIYCTDFETDPTSDGWSSAALRGVDNWQWGTPQGAGGDAPSAYSGTRVVGNDVSADGLYDADSTNRMISPVIDVSGYDVVRLQYRRWLTVEESTWDKATIYVNDTSVWQNVGGDGAPHHLDSQWRFHDVDITSAAAANSVQIAFELLSDTGSEFGGWNLDDVCIVGYAAVEAVDAGTNPAVDAGTDPGGGDGCGCTSTDPTPAGLGLIAVMLLALRRRRYQSRSLRRRRSRLRASPPSPSSTYSSS